MVSIFLATLLTFVAVSVTQAQSEGAAKKMDQQRITLVARLLAHSSKDEHPLKGAYRSDFFIALSELASKQPGKGTDFIEFDVGKHTRGGIGSGGRFVRGRAIRLVADKKNYVVAVLGIPETIVAPGTDVEQLVLMDPNGVFLDKVACAINARYGRLETVVTPKDGIDGELTIRFIARQKKPWLPWFTIAHGGNAFTFYEHEHKTHSEIYQKGVCQLVIRKDKFAVIYPKLGQSDADYLKEIIIPGRRQ